MEYYSGSFNCCRVAWSNSFIVCAMSEGSEFLILGFMWSRCNLKYDYSWCIRFICSSVMGISMILKAVVDIDLKVLFPFSIGCLIGIVSLSHLISWVFKNYKI